MSKTEKDIIWMQFLKAVARNPLSTETEKLTKILVEQNAKDDPELHALFNDENGLMSPIFSAKKDELRRQLNREYVKTKRDPNRKRKFGAKKYKQ